MLTEPKIQAKISSHSGDCFGRGSVVRRCSNGEGLRNTQHSLSIVLIHCDSYYKIPLLLQNVTAILLQNATKVYYKIHQVFYYKMRQLLQNLAILLQIATAHYCQFSLASS